MKRIGIIILFFAILTGCEKMNPDPWTIEAKNSFSEGALYDVTLYFYGNEGERYETKKVGYLAPGETSESFEIGSKFLKAKAGARFVDDITGDTIHRYTKSYFYSDKHNTTIFIDPLQLVDPYLE
jgi:hypothetical protein